MKRILLLTLACLVVFTGGCGITSHLSNDRVAAVPYDSNCLWNLKVGREYVAQGRYELAKEHYLMALAASNDGETRQVVSHELASVDMMIKSQR